MTEAAKELSLAGRICALIETGEIQPPPLPELAVRVQRLLADEDRVDAKKVEELIRNEPAVAASILRIANSATFGGLSEVHELSQAIARLGLKHVGSIVNALLMKSSLTSVPRDKLKLLETLWGHSVSAAICSQALAGKAGCEPEEAFLAALLQDCGRALVLKAADVLEKQDEIEITEAVLVELMDRLHRELGHTMLKGWRLPDSICEVALKHDDAVEDGSSPLLVCVGAANLICRKLGVHIDPDPDLALLEEPAIDALGLSDVGLAAMMIDVEDRLDELRQLF